jgi:aryl-alcohol dehydrogenase-like predicted oxidoreductase
MNKTGEDIFVIPGTRKEKYLLDNFGGGAVQLSKEDLAEYERLQNHSRFPVIAILTQ